MSHITPDDALVLDPGEKPGHSVTKSAREWAKILGHYCYNYGAGVYRTRALVDGGVIVDHAITRIVLAFSASHDITVTLPDPFARLLLEDGHDID